MIKKVGFQEVNLATVGRTDWRRTRLTVRDVQKAIIVF